jgi:ADP-ribose pyrophosphatase
MKPFKILSSEKVLWEKFYKVEKQVVELPNGSSGEWYIKVNNDAVIMVPITEDGQVLLQHNYKHGCGEIITEFCAGLIDDGETWEDATNRELSEETGYEAAEYIKLGEVFASPTSSKMKYHLVLAKNIQKVRKPHLEPEEQIETFMVQDIDEAARILQDQAHPTSSGVMTALYFAKEYLKS